MMKQGPPRYLCTHNCGHDLAPPRLQLSFQLHVYVQEQD